MNKDTRKPSGAITKIFLGIIISGFFIVPLSIVLALFDKTMEVGLSLLFTYMNCIILYLFWRNRWTLKIEDRTKRIKLFFFYIWMTIFITSSSVIFLLVFEKVYVTNMLVGIELYFSFLLILSLFIIISHLSKRQDIRYYLVVLSCILSGISLLFNVVYNFRLIDLVLHKIYFILWLVIWTIVAAIKAIAELESPGKE